MYLYGRDAISQIPPTKTFKMPHHKSYLSYEICSLHAATCSLVMLTGLGSVGRVRVGFGIFLGGYLNTQCYSSQGWLVNVFAPRYLRSLATMLVAIIIVLSTANSGLWGMIVACLRHFLVLICRFIQFIGFVVLPQRTLAVLVYV